MGLFPFPGNLLVSQYFPWYNGGWTGYDSWTTTKSTLASDAIRQHIPWLQFTFSNLKQNSSIPLWNPYNYSGVPHFANIQTFIFNPLNLLFALLPLSTGWILFIILQLPLGISFTYIFLRSLSLSKTASLFGGLAFVFSSYFIIWFEIGIVDYSILWLPLILYAIQNVLLNFKLRYLFLLIITSVACTFSGHIQTAIYIMLIAVAYYTFKLLSIKKVLRIKAISLAAIWIISTLLLTAIQTLPALELYINSPLIKSFSKDVFNIETMPFKNILTLFAPDLFGNPANNNLWTTAYGDGTPNIGIIPLFFSIFALFNSKRRETIFFLSLSIVFILFATKSPLYLLIRYLSVPILTGTSPVRTMFAFCFGMSVLAAFGFESYTKSKKLLKSSFLLVITFLITYITFIVSTFIIPLILKNREMLATNLLVSRRNLIIPSACILFLFLIFISRKIFSKSKIYSRKLEIFMIIGLTLVIGIYQFNKTSHFSKIQNFFPSHPLISWLQDKASINRFYGEGTARFENNFATYYHVFTPEGYSVFRISRYAELIASQDAGEIPVKYNRADANISNINDFNKKRLLNLLGVKYLISKDDLERDARIQDPNRPEDDANLVWQSGKFKIYERSKTLPRFFLSSNYITAKNDQEILDKIYDKDFDLRTIILEKNPTFAPSESQASSVELLSYKPDNISFKTTAENDTLLFLSDAFYPGWEANMDNTKTNIYRADYAFRAVEVPKGEHTISFNFRPKSFYYGMYTTLVGIILMLVYFAFSLKKKTF